MTGKRDKSDEKSLFKWILEAEQRLREQNLTMPAFAETVFRELASLGSEKRSLHDGATAREVVRGVWYRRFRGSKGELPDAAADSLLAVAEQCGRVILVRAKKRLGELSDPRVALVITDPTCEPTACLPSPFFNSTTTIIDCSAL